jgi:uncharacterized UPF0160 family protein
MTIAISSTEIGAIATHNGVFHSDEITAIALLLEFGLGFGDRDITIIRTRDKAVLETTDILIDVGGEYDGIRKFDHHQWSNEDPEFGRSSAGLILDRLGIGERYPSIVHLIKEVDNQDIGIERQPEHHYCNIIKSYNTSEIYAVCQNDAFLEALEFSRGYLRRLGKKDDIQRGLVGIAKTITITEINDIKIAIFSRKDPFIPANLLIGRADISVGWDSGQDCWTIQTIPLKAGEFGSKYQLEPTGRPEEVFTHAGGFISKVKEDSDKVISFKLKGEDSPLFIQTS